VLSCIRHAIAIVLNQVGIDCSGISRDGMNTDEDNAMGGKSLLLEDAEKKTFLCLVKCFLVRSHWRISQVEDVLNVMAPSSGKEMMMPRMLNETYSFDLITVAL
jgi:hypothetical protein